MQRQQVGFFFMHICIISINRLMNNWLMNSLHIWALTHLNLYCCRNCGWNLWTRSDCCLMRKRFCHCGKRCKVNRLFCNLKTWISLRKPARTMVQKHNEYFWSEVLHRGFFYFIFNIHCILWCAARDRILSNLQNHPVPRPAPELQKQKAPVAEIPSACLTDSEAAADLIQTDLNILQEQARYIWSAAHSLLIHTKKYIYIYICIPCFLELQWHVKPSRWH